MNNYQLKNMGFVIYNNLMYFILVLMQKIFTLIVMIKVRKKNYIHSFKML